MEKFVLKYFDLIRTVIAILIGLVISVSLIYLISKEPTLSLRSFLLGPFLSRGRLGNLIETASPIIFGGLAIAGIFLMDIRLGIMAWLAAAAHEIPQELGDFGVLVHGGWSKGRALLFNVLSALTFLLGGLVAYAGSLNFDVAFLIPFAAGNFLYIAASDLVPEVSKHGELKTNAVNLLAFIAGMALMLLVKAAFD